jgi:hypothetical protein
MGVGAAVAACLGDDADGVCMFDPLAGRQRKTIQSCLFSNPIEFDGIKSRVVWLVSFGWALFPGAVSRILFEDASRLWDASAERREVPDCRVR